MDCLTEYKRPWELVTLSISIGFLVKGSFYYKATDWDIPINLIMEILTYLLPPVSLGLW